MRHASRARTSTFAFVVVVVLVTLFWDHVVAPRLGDLTAFLAALTFALLAFAGRWTYDRVRGDSE